MTGLEQRWTKLCHRLGIAAHAEPGWQRLQHLYATPRRAYHNLAHIADCLAQLDGVCDELEVSEAVEPALWWHDAVYDSRARDNEEQSAGRWLGFAAEAGVEATLARDVARLVRSTDHRAVAPDPAGLLIQDLDLSILGRSPEVFDDYERCIREEYDWADETAFRKGRTAFLRELLGRPALFNTPALRQRFEAAARVNLARSLARWEL